MGKGALCSPFLLLRLLSEFLKGSIAEGFPQALHSPLGRVGGDLFSGRDLLEPALLCSLLWTPSENECLTLCARTTPLQSGPDPPGLSPLRWGDDHPRYSPRSCALCSLVQLPAEGVCNQIATVASNVVKSQGWDKEGHPSGWDLRLLCLLEETPRVVFLS